MVSRGRLAPGDEQWPLWGQTDQQADQGQGHGARAQGLVQVVGDEESSELSAGSWNISTLVPILTLPYWVPDSI